jgi:hypothetical protein
LQSFVFINLFGLFVIIFSHLFSTTYQDISPIFGGHPARWLCTRRNANGTKFVQWLLWPIACRRYKHATAN